MELKTIKKACVDFIKDEEGLTIVEYAVAGGIITVAVVAGFRLLGGEVDTQIRATCAAVKGSAC